MSEVVTFLGPIAPHGGVLVNRVLPENAANDFLARAQGLAKVMLDERTRADFELVATGAFSPLDGFMNQADYLSVVKEMRLASGVPFSVPVVLTVSDEQAKSLKLGQEVALVLSTDAGDEIVGSLVVDELFPIDRELEADNVYKTREQAHPGVAYLYQRAQNVAVAGKILLAKRSIHREFPEHHRDPAETRQLLADRGWKKVVGFQTRNPVHRAHEYLIKSALETVDGLLLHPLVGETKKDDVPADVRMKCYEVLLDKYFAPERALLSVLPLAMRYAGPREAVLHAILRQNYGCTHFIVGRDHAGVGSYYGTYDAHRIFEQFQPGELGIELLFFEHTFYNKRFGEFGSTKTLPGGPEDRLMLSGTAVRQMLTEGKLPPPEFSRPEVAQILLEAYKNLLTVTLEINYGYLTS
jgi:sulfate adenylyltransferase